MKYRLCFAMFFIALSLNAKGDTLTKDEGNILDFGVVELPSAGSGTVTVNAAGGNSSSGVNVITNPTRGHYTINCTETTGDITIDLTPLPTSGNLTLTDVEIYYKDTTYTTFPATGLANPNGTPTDLYIGGKMTCSSAATPGVDTTTLNVKVELTCPT